MEYWIALAGLPSGGLSLIVDEPAIWAEPLHEFGMNCSVCAPLRAEVFLSAQEGGCFVRGRLTGTVSLPCDRCAEDARVVIEQPFEMFEAVPCSPSPNGTPDGDPDSDIDENVARLGESGPEINLAALLWEEFSLSLPIHPLCRPDCAGLCPECGKNRNAGDCACSRDQGDPRLAALRGLTVT